MIIGGYIIFIVQLLVETMKFGDDIQSQFLKLIEGIFPQNMLGKRLFEHIKPSVIIKGFCDLDRIKDKRKLHNFSLAKLFHFLCLRRK